MTHTTLITGAASGIGKALAEKLATDGHTLVLVDIDPRVSEVAAAIGDSALATVADITDPEQVRDVVAQGLNRFETITGLVNNAGIVDNIGSVEQMPFDAWQKEIAVNLTGAFNLMQAVLPGMRKQGFGRIVTVSSAAARGGIALQPGYCASKSALLGLSKSVVLEYAPFGITSNCVLPGFTATEKVNGMPAPVQDALKAATPMGRFGTLDEATGVIAFLLSPDAGYVNGAEIDVGGGVHLNSANLAGKARYS